MLNSTKLNKFVSDNIHEFHNSRLSRLENISLKDVLKKKNPYLFKAKNILNANELVCSILEAFLSSSEEKIFGDFLEKLAIFVASETHNGIKSSATGIDLEFNKNAIRYIVSIKSGPNWGNSSQYQSLKTNFKKAKIVLSQHQQAVQPILGICYGKTRTTDDGLYKKFTGQSFWHFLSSDPDLYTKIIEPIGYQAKKFNDTYIKEKSTIQNRFTKEFIEDFCNQSGEINWEALIKFNSQNIQSP